LIGSVATLIDSAEITELTASKIKAGTITSSIISLDGVNSIIQSTGYEAGVTGWAIKGNGNAEFSAASIRGGLKAESVFINTNNRWRRNAGDTAANSEFKVGNATDYLYYDGVNTLTFTGDLSAAGGTFSGALSAATGTFSGSLSAATGTFSGSLSAATGTFSGDLSAAGGTFSGDLSAAGGTFEGRLQAGDIYVPNTSNPRFYVDSNGYMVCSDANISGTVTASSGSIGGWIIDGGGIRTAGTYYVNVPYDPIAMLLSNGAFVVYQWDANQPGSFVVDPDNGVLLNAVSLRSRTTGGSKTHWYPYSDNSKALRSFKL